jgi:hypothetical protein
MIKVRVCDQHEIQSADVKVQCATVFSCGVASTLKKAAINDETYRMCFHQVA